VDIYHQAQRRDGLDMWSVRQRPVSRCSAQRVGCYRKWFEWKEGREIWWSRFYEHVSTALHYAAKQLVFLPKKMLLVIAVS